jgi:nicotinate-nucleotide adenylyltransferase
MMRLGLFGGTFDPVHYGHLRTVEAARRELALDEVLLLPNPQPPHKQHVELTPYEHRKQMLRLALREFPGLKLADYEESALGPAYTTDTVRRVIADLPANNHELWLLIGADSLLELPLWKDPEALFRDAKVAVLPRPGVKLEDAKPEFLRRVRVLRTPLIDVSATEIRGGIRAGLKSIDMLPPAVLDYCREYDLYSAPVNRD